jgi:hypothetical protein
MGEECGRGARLTATSNAARAGPAVVPRLLERRSVITVDHLHEPAWGEAAVRVDPPAEELEETPLGKSPADEVLAQP